MSLQNTIILARLLAQLSRPFSVRPPPGIQEERSLALRRAELDLYRPRQQCRAAVLAVHGVTVLGGRDPRLVHFARSLAAVGVACAVPTLPRLSSCQWDPSDIDALAEVVDDVMSRTARAPGLIGFSHGASYALVLAAREAFARKVRFVLAFGPYHDLESMLQGHASAAAPDDRDAEAVDNWIYLHFVLAHGLGQRAGLSEPAAAELAGMMRRYCHHASLQQKQDLFREHIAPLDVLNRALSLRDPCVLRAVSPAGKLGGIACPVSLVHDVRDGVVPPEQSERIYRELCQREATATQTLLLTRLLSHVALRDALRLGEVGKLLAALRPVVLAG